MNDGVVASTRGLEFPVARFEEHVIEEQATYSHALHAVLRGRGPYLTGPLARYALNHERLTPLAREAAREAGLGPLVRNPFKSIVVRAVELVLACEEGLRLVECYEPPEPPPAAASRPGTGRSATEAPRGILYHRYDVDGGGLIRKARIVPPTAQNQKSIEGDLAQLVPLHLSDSRAALTLLCERAVRNHDPCISCATHFLRLEVVPWPSSPSP
jgi:coenzyme F420-reducing hydrogenase alpha subunit